MVRPHLAQNVEAHVTLQVNVRVIHLPRGVRPHTCGSAACTSAQSGRRHTFVLHFTFGASCGYVVATLNVKVKEPPLWKPSSGRMVTSNTSSFSRPSGKAIVVVRPRFSSDRSAWGSRRRGRRWVSGCRGASHAAPGPCLWPPAARPRSASAPCCLTRRRQRPPSLAYPGGGRGEGARFSGGARDRRGCARLYAEKLNHLPALRKGCTATGERGAVPSHGRRPGASSRQLAI